jgi:RND family efflux transporter MFP subunit
VATWPAGEPAGAHLAKAAEKALADHRPLALQLEPQPGRDAPSRTCIAQPIESPVEGDSEPCGVVVIDLAPRSTADLQFALRQLSWGSAWLELAAVRESGSETGDASSEVLQIVSTPLDHDRFSAAATALMTDLAGRFGCDRVSFGAVARGRVSLQAVSHSALFNERANLTRAVESAMEEALDQECTIVHPEPTGDTGATRITRAHARLCGSERDDAGDGTACSIPVAHGDRYCAVVTLERRSDRPFSPAELRVIEAAVSLAGPMLEAQRREDRWLVAKALDSLREFGEKLVGPRHVGLKLALVASLALLLVMTFSRADYRVTADAALEARVLRAAVAPFDGFVAEAPARAGDRVSKGDLLATLDDRELRLERTRWASQLQQLVKQYRQAMAERDAAQVRIYSAQMDQVRAQLSLVEEQLSKMVLTAPFDGIVLTGDLSQELGAPVQRGELLYEVAPLEEYRVVLEVDERDIDEIAVGQHGSLVFSAFPGEPVAFTVEQLTPVSTPAEGRNTFRVEAALDETPADLQPGMEGVGKVEIDRRRLIWIWTHDVVDWLRLVSWRWLP